MGTWSKVLVMESPEAFHSVQGDAPESASSVNNDREREDILSSLFPFHPSPVGIELEMQQHIEFFPR